MVKSSALSELLGLFESAGAADFDPSQPVNSSRIADAATSAGSHRWRSTRKFVSILGRRLLTTCSSWQVPRSFRFLQLFERGHVGSQRLAIGQLHGAIAPLGIQIIQKAGRATLVGVFTDVAGILRLFEIARSIKVHHAFITPDSFIGIGNVGKNGIAGSLLLLLRLRERVLGA